MVNAARISEISTGFVCVFATLFHETLKCFYSVSNVSVRQIKDVRQLSWMSHGNMRFKFLLNFLFISAFFDILASLSVSCVFASGYPIINISAVNQAVFYYY